MDFIRRRLKILTTVRPAYFNFLIHFFPTFPAQLFGGFLSDLITLRICQLSVYVASTDRQSNTA